MYIIESQRKVLLTSYKSNDVSLHERYIVRYSKEFQITFSTNINKSFLFFVY